MHNEFENNFSLSVIAIWTNGNSRKKYVYVIDVVILQVISRNKHLALDWATAKIFAIFSSFTQFYPKKLHLSWAHFSLFLLPSQSSSFPYKLCKTTYFSMHPLPKLKTCWLQLGLKAKIVCAIFLPGLYLMYQLCDFTIQPQTPPPLRSSPPFSVDFRVDFWSFLLVFDRFWPILVKNGPNRLEIGSSSKGCSGCLAERVRGSVGGSQVTIPAK